METNMKITIEHTKLKNMVADAYKAGYSYGYKSGMKDGIKDILRKDISDIPFDSDSFLMDNALYLCTLHPNEVAICKYKDGQFHKHKGPKEIKIEDIINWKRI